ncbi:MAG TPA: CHASE3 domain-containing protein, partial [Phenylobacterium sp.]|nr:CHASE3 domain-containing protein [Phenylobacterium sp.]
MPQNRVRTSFGIRSGAEIGTVIGLATVLAFFLLSGLVAYFNIQTLRLNNQKVLHSHEVLIALEDLLSTTQDAETGQRGYLLTGDEKYLEPYDRAAAQTASRIDAVASLTADNPTQRTSVALLRPHIDAKLAELRQTIDLRRTKGPDAALAVVTTGHGKAEMDAIRAQADAMRQEELRLRQIRLAEMDAAFKTALVSGLLSGLLGAVLTVVVFVLIRRDAAGRARQQWLQAGQVGLADAMMGDKSVDQLADGILAFLAHYLGVQAGALFYGDAEQYVRAATLGVPAEADIPERFGRKEGLLGQVAADGRPMVVRDVPKGYLTIGSALGQDTPRHLVIVPALADDLVNAVIELGFLHAVDDRVVELLAQVSGAMGIALRSAR